MSSREIGDVREGKMSDRSFVIARTILLFLGRVLIGMRLKGVERVPNDGPLLVVSNHIHNADPLIVCIATPRPVYFMAKEELMTIPVIGPLIRWGGAFPIARGKADRLAIRRAIAILDQGVAVGMFPEGTRSKTWQMKDALAGAGFVATMGKAMILPVAITGTESLPFAGSAGRRRVAGRFLPRVTVTFGEPFTLPATDEDGRRLSPEAATTLMMRRVAEMLPEGYRGVYGETDTGSGRS